MIVFNEDGCIRCGACEGTCPTSAIDVTPTSIIHCDTCGENQNVLMFVLKAH